MLRPRIMRRFCIYGWVLRSHDHVHFYPVHQTAFIWDIFPHLLLIPIGNTHSLRSLFISFVHIWVCIFWLSFALCIASHRITLFAVKSLFALCITKVFVMYICGCVCRLHWSRVIRNCLLAGLLACCWIVLVRCICMDRGRKDVSVRRRLPCQALCLLLRDVCYRVADSRIPRPFFVIVRFFVGFGCWLLLASYFDGGMYRWRVWVCGEGWGIVYR
jgi:hypothetical protein